MENNQAEEMFNLSFVASTTCNMDSILSFLLLNAFVAHLVAQKQKVLRIN